MKVLVIPSWYPTNIDPIAGSFIADQVLALKRRQVDVGVLFGVYSFDNIFANELVGFDRHGHINQALIGSGFTFPKVNKFFLDLWCRRYFRLYLQFEKKFGKPDLIHAHSFIAGYFASYLKRKINRPAILTEHHFEFLKPPELQKKRYLNIFKSVASEMDSLFSVSKALKIGMMNYTDKSIGVIPNHFDPKIFNFRTNKRQNYFCEATPFQVLGIGSFNENKGFEQLIKALHILKKNQLNCTLKLVGTGPLEKYFQVLIKELDLKNEVRLIANLSRIEVAEIMKSSHLLVNSSSIETFGITILEALACGVPVLSSANGGPASLISESNGLLVGSNDCKVISSAIETIYHNYQTYNRVDIASDVKMEFSEEVVIPRIVNEYKRLVSCVE